MAIDLESERRLIRIIQNMNESIKKHKVYIKHAMEPMLKNGMQLLIQ